MKISKMLPVAMLLAIISSSYSLAETLTVDAGSSVAPGASGVSVVLSIDDGSNTAGASFTVTYDTTKLTLIDVSSSFFDTFSSQNITPASITIGTDTYTQGMVHNPTTGGTMLAAAGTTNGEVGPQTLFTLTFDVAGNALGNYPINIIDSIIENEAAGYSTPTVIPMLVGIDSATFPVSYPSITPSITPGTLIVGATDTDEDGLNDDIEINMGTDPYLADSDGDGLNDGEEFSYWGSNWNGDPDGDGLINILDNDADNDGYLDGAEVLMGTDPSDQTSHPAPMAYIYEDAEDGNINGWDIKDANPAGAVISNVFDDLKQSRVIELSGDAKKNAYRLRNDDGSDWQDADFKVMQWSMRYDEDFVVNITVKTSNGTRYLSYTPDDTDNLGTDFFIHHGLGSQIIDGNWYTVTRDLEYDLKEAQPGNELIEVLNFVIKGSGRVDDIKTIAANPGTHDSDGDTISDNDEIYIYGTDPDYADSDIDGIDDGEELAYWGSNWNGDPDTDGLINILDPDSDGDGVMDGTEIHQGTDPANSGSYPTVIVYEDAEDGNINGWEIYDADPVGAAVSNVFDDLKQSRAIELSGNATENGFILRNDDGSDWHDADFKVMQWSMRYDETFVVSIAVQTHDGIRYLDYTPDDTDNLGTDIYIHHGLGSQLVDGNWHTLIRDLEYDLKEAQPDNELTEVLGFLIRGSGRVDDIKTIIAIPDTHDSDGDTITDNDEIYTYGTHPYSTDTDNDGINDGEELAYWATSWNGDPDGDGLINILDSDADNDGYLDGAEVSGGTDPSDPNSNPAPMVHVYEDAEDGNINGWDIKDANPAGAVISNVFDDLKQSRVVELSGDAKKNAYRLRNDDGSDWQDADFKTMQWSMQYDEDFVVNITVKTSDGTRYLSYTPDDIDNLGTDFFIHHGLGSQLIDGNWHTIIRDLEYDLKEAQPSNELIEVLNFVIKGSGRVDDIKTMQAPPP